MSNKQKIYSAYCHAPYTLPKWNINMSPHTYADKRITRVPYKGKEVLAVLRIGAYDPNKPFWMIPGYVSDEQDIKNLEIEWPVEHNISGGAKTYIERKLDESERSEFEGLVKKIVDAPVEFWK